MVKIKTENVYNKIMCRIEELHHIVNNETSTDDKNSKELDVLSSLIEEFEDDYYPIGKPSLATLKIAREISHRLYIDSYIVLRV